MLLLSIVRVCLQSAGWSWGRLKKLTVYLRSASKTSRDRSRYPTHTNTHPHNTKHKSFYWNIQQGCDYLSSQVWSESSDGSGAVNFLTGMGGFLQAVLFGYTGFRYLPFTHNEKTPCMFVHTARRQWYKDWHTVFFRVQKDCLAFSPLLPNDISELCVRGVNYLGSQMDWLLRKDEVCIILREQESSASKSCDLQVVLKASGTKIPLTPGNTQAKTFFCFFRKRFIYALTFVH